MSGVIAVLGFGEAGSLIARDLVAAGAAVRGFDPQAPAPAGVTAAGSDAEAVTGADLVLSVNSASEAVAAFTASIDALAAAAIWADLNTASPAVKQRLAALGRERAIPVTDIAMMAPVPGNGLRVPMLASGDAADRVAATLRGYGADIEVLDGPAGLAATRKLLRSVFYKGMAVVDRRGAGSGAGGRPRGLAAPAHRRGTGQGRRLDGRADRHRHPAARRPPRSRDGGRRRDAHRPGRPAHHGRRQPRPARAPGSRRKPPVEQITARSASTRRSAAR